MGILVVIGPDIRLLASVPYKTDTKSITCKARFWQKFYKIDTKSDFQQGFYKTDTECPKFVLLKKRLLAKVFRNRCQKFTPFGKWSRFFLQTLAISGISYCTFLQQWLEDVEKHLGLITLISTTHSNICISFIFFYLFFHFTYSLVSPFVFQSYLQQVNEYFLLTILLFCLLCFKELLGQDVV